MKRNNNELFNKAKSTIDMSNLKRLIKKHNYSITKVAMNAGINDSTLYEYLKNNASPSLPVLINLANFFNCNLDYLIGRTNTPTQLNNTKTEELSDIIHLIDSLNKDEQKIVDAFLQGIIKEKEKINN